MSAPAGNRLALLRRHPRSAVALTLAALAGGGLWAALGGEGEDGRSWHRVERRDLVREVEVVGELAARHARNFGPPIMNEMWNFKIAALATEGAEVAAGDVVLSFDDSDLRLRLERAVGDRDQAEKTLEKRRTDLAIERRNASLRHEEAEAKVRRTRLKVDVPAELLARNELDTVRVDLELAEVEAGFRRAQLERLEQGSRAELEALEQAAAYARNLVGRLEGHIERMNVLADRPGTVIYASNWRGEKRRLGDTIWREEVVLRIPDLHSQLAIVQIDEADSSRVALGQTARLRLDAHPDRVFEARVAKIHRAIQQRSWRDPRRIMRLELALDDIDLERMRPGMRLLGRLEVERVPSVIAIPLEAVFSTPDGAAVRVRTAVGERLVRPELGRRDRDWIEVRVGLEPGDRVLLPAAQSAAAERHS